MSPVRDIHPSTRTISLCEESPPQCLNHWPGRKVIIPHRGGTNVPREVSPVNSIYVSKSPFGRKNAQGSLFARLVPCNSPGGPTTVLFCASEIVLRVRLARSAAPSGPPCLLSLDSGPILDSTYPDEDPRPSLDVS